MTSPAPRTSSARTSLASTSRARAAARRAAQRAIERRGPRRPPAPRRRARRTRTRSSSTERRARADRPGPATTRPGCCSSARSRASTTSSTPPSSGSPASATACCSPTPSAPRGPLDRLRAARRGGRAAAGQRLLAARRPRPARARDRRERLVRHGLAYCLASDTHPGTPRAHAAARLRVAACAPASSEIQAARLTAVQPALPAARGQSRAWRSRCTAPTSSR